MSERERNLLFTAWVILLTLTALWHFRPGDQNSKTAPEILITSDLKRWFDSGTVTGQSEQNYTVQLTVQSNLNSLPRDGLFVQYSLVRQNKTRKKGTGKCQFVPGSAVLSVPVLERSSVDAILLDLAH